MSDNKQYAKVRINTDTVHEDDSIYHRFLKDEKAKIDAELDDGHVVIGEGIHRLYAPETQYTVGSSEANETDFGVFAILVSKSKILVVHKKTSTGSVWFVPGGLVGTNDASLSKALTRNVFEETGIKLDDHNYRPWYLQEFTTSCRHDLIQFYSIEDDDLCRQMIVGGDDILEAVWTEPGPLYADIKMKRKTSICSMNLVFDHYLKAQFRRGGPEFLLYYERFKENILRNTGVDPKLIDLCVVPLLNNSGFVQNVPFILGQAFEKAKRLVNIE